MYREQLEAYFQDKQDMLVDATCWWTLCAAWCPLTV